MSSQTASIVPSSRFSPSIGAWSHPDAVLLRDCNEILAAQPGRPELFTPVAPATWPQFATEVDQIHGRVEQVSRTPAWTEEGLRAKALVLKSLLDAGDQAGLYEDAAAPDQIAWSLVDDLLRFLAPPAAELAQR